MVSKRPCDTVSPGGGVGGESQAGGRVGTRLQVVTLGVFEQEEQGGWSRVREWRGLGDRIKEEGWGSQNLMCISIPGGVRKGNAEMLPCNKH